jgi:hypothetical protein
MKEKTDQVHGQDWMDNWWKGLPDAFGNIDAEGQDEGTSNITNFEANPYGINFTMAAWLYTITKVRPGNAIIYC